MRHYTQEEGAAAIAVAPRGVWLHAGGKITDPYPCRCHERKYERCSAAWCPCAGRSDPPHPECCGSWFGPADHIEGQRRWRIEQLRRQAEEEG